MYVAHFNLREPPFSIAPDPAYLYLSARHQEALGHLLYGTGQYGGFVQLTGEVGTGKTTVLRTLLRQKLDDVDIAMVHNPCQSEAEFVASICDEFGVDYPHTPAPTLKTLVDALNAHLLRTHAAGRRSVLIIDEAQNLSPQVLEQVRLLTNLETDKEKLLRIMLVGQPELAELLARPELRQLAGRITARYHLLPLDETETREYIAHRLRVAGGSTSLFPPASVRCIQRRTRGIPRAVNIVCDRALLGAYARGLHQVTPAVAAQAADEALGAGASPLRHGWLRRRLPGVPLVWVEAALACAGLIVAGILLERALGPQAGARIVAASASTPAASATTGASIAAMTGAPLVRLRQPDNAESATDPSPQTTRPPSAAASAAAPAPALDRSPAPATAPAAGLGRILAAPESIGTLMERLIALWNPDIRVPAGANVCTTLAKADLQCYQGKGQWIDLKRMDRPVILSLTVGRGTRYALLTRLDGDTAVVDDGSGGSVRIPRAQLGRIWNGGFLLLWRSAIGVPSTLVGPGSRGKMVIWLRGKLAQLAGQSPPATPSPVYDASLRQRILDYQRSAGLKVDGLVGAVTLISLSAAGHEHDTPTLHGPTGGSS